MSRRRLAPSDVFAANPWPPFVDVMTAMLASFVVIMLVLALSQRKSVVALRKQEAELTRLREDKARIERRLRAVAASGLMEVAGGRVIMQGEVLFDSGSAALRPEGQAFLAKLAPVLAQLLAEEADQMVMVGGHTDDLPIHHAAFRNNLELSSARATFVAKVLTDAGLPAARVIAAGFGEHHPRVPNSDNESRGRNRRIEIGLVPMHALTQP
jgi:flagellar motor protein MotB